MRRVSNLLLISLVAVSLIACGLLKSPEPRYGREHNEERKKVGLPIIPDDWELYKVNTEYCVWVNPKRLEKEKHNIPVHWSKDVSYRTGTLLYEADRYYGREYYTSGDGTFRESLGIAYYYQEDPRNYQSRLGWSITLRNKDAPYGVEISLEEAERILEEWGIERLSYEFPLDE